ncbi:MAG TPA: GGDEF domain-containing protein [Pilimelia sp.]|nr:GGDEF domain-containing protein [Pilimelia sp.]
MRNGRRAKRAGRLNALRAELDELESLPHEHRADASARAHAAEERARELGAVDLQMRAQLVQADAIARRGRTAASARIIREVNRWAQEYGHRYLLARSHRHLAALIRTLGDYPTSLEHAVRAVELLDDDTPPKVRIDHDLMLAITLARIGDFDTALARCRSALHEADRQGFTDLHIALLNNVSYMNYMAGRTGDALAAAREMAARATAHGRPLNPTFVDTLGRALLAAGNPREAAGVLEAALRRIDHHGGEPDALADCLLTLAEARRALAELDLAHGSLDECETLCEARGLAEVRVRVHQERAALYAAQERYREAYEEHRRFYAASAALFTSERDGRAKIVQAVFETAEARRDRERFRRLSLHDPLTGLYNRRYVDERLPELLVHAARDATPLAVALADLDHFKRINDSLSHETGDAVLVAVAGILEASMPRDGFAARLGGEEFLLVLPGLDEPAAVALCERIRQLLHRHDWSGVTGGTPVTASFGVAVPEPPATQVALLRRADAHLYAAKSAGRDRVVSDPAAGSGPAEPGAGRRAA